MQVLRRDFLFLTAGAAAVPAVSRTANAQAYPARPVHLIVGFPAGGAPDIIARLTGQWLSERLDQQFIGRADLRPQQSLLALIDSIRFIPLILIVRTTDSPLHRPATAAT